MVVLLATINFDNIKLGFKSNGIGFGFAMLLFTIGSRPTQKNLSKYLIGLIVILEIICFRLHTQSVHFLALSIYICLIFYCFTGRFSLISFISILIFSSIFSKLFEYHTIEIKQSLCNMVYKTLQNTMNFDKIEGVNFYIHNKKITVDTACMGLSMFKTGLLLAALLMTIAEKQVNKYYSVLQILVFCVFAILFNIISNYFRIILLLITDETKENFCHHAIGILCFIIYQILPMFFVLKIVKPSQIAHKDLPKKAENYIWTLPTLLLIVVSFQLKTKINSNILCGLEQKYTLQKGIWVNPDVFQIQTSNKITYIKTISHKPLVCWTGNGYKITKSEKITKNNEFIWHNVMQKDSVTFDSYWWYESDQKKYTTYLEVMLIRLLSNKPMRLINEVTLREVPL